MKIALLGSQSPIKLAVCKQIFGAAFEHEILAYAASSGVNEQPFNDETQRGAFNRINAARNVISNADYYLSIENGIFEEDGRYIDRGIVVIEAKDGERIIARSDGVEFPEQYVEETRKRSGGFQKWTVGKIMAEHGVVSNHADPHQDLDPKGRTREDFLMQAAAGGHT